MSRLFFTLGLALVLAACGSGNTPAPAASQPESGPASGVTPATPPTPGGGHQTVIVFTANPNKGTGAGQYDSDCLGAVATESIDAARGENITWRIDTTHGNVSQSCAPQNGFDKSAVSLHFLDSLTTGSMTVNANNGGIITATVASTAADGAQKYQVFYKDKAAGPDPEIFIRCPTCGGGEGGPGGGGNAP